MSRILVEVRIPAASLRRDAFIPFEMPMHEVMALLKSALADDVTPVLQMSDDMVLCDAATGAIFNVNWTPEEIGLEDGSQIMLI